MIIHCEYCGAEFSSLKGTCPKCGAQVAGNKEIEEQKIRDDKIADEIKAACDFETRKKVEEYDKRHPYLTRMTPQRVNLMKAIGLIVAIIIVLIIVFGIFVLPKLV